MPATPAGQDPSLPGIVASMRRHLDRGDPLAGYPDRLAALAASGQGLRGYLTGSLDAVLRLPGDDGAPRFVVVDYKTNWLGAWGLYGAAEPDAPDARRRAGRVRRAGRARGGGRSAGPSEPDALTAWHYRPEALVAAMQSAHYPLAGAAVSRGAAPVPALAAARLRARKASGWSSLPVSARHVRSGHAVRGRGALRGLLLAAPARARRRGLGPVRPGRAVTTASKDGSLAGPVRRAAGPARAWPAAPVQRRGRAGRRRRAGRASASGASWQNPTSRCCWPPRWRCVRCGSGRCAWTLRRFATRSRWTWPSPRTSKPCRGRR